jgi:transcriptional regulator with XRE-family HTH domain
MTLVRDDFLPDFPSELRRLRTERGWSLRDMSLQVSYTPGHISKIEGRHGKPSREFARICDIRLGAEGRLFALAFPVAPADVFGTDLGLGEIDADLPAPVALDLPVFVERLTRYRDQGRRTEPRALLRLLVAELGMLCHHVDGAGGNRREVLAVAARFAEYAGWMAQESGGERLSLELTGRAVRLAGAAEDREMAAHAMVRRALITLYRQDAAGTVRLGELAQADARVSARIRGLGSLREAQGHALAAEYSLCLRALERGRRRLDEAKAEEGPMALGPSTVVDPANMTTGWCLTELGREDAAAAMLAVEIARLPSDAHRTRLRYTTRQALAYAKSGERDAACSLAAEALPGLRGVASATIAADVARLIKTLNRWSADRPVRELLPALHSLTYFP